MKQLLPLLLLFVFACNNNIQQAKLMKNLDSKQLSSLDKISQLHLLISFDYNKKQDSVFLTVGNQTSPFSPSRLHATLQEHNNKIDPRMHRQIRIALYIDSDLPFEYVEQIFNTFRGLAQRRLFLVTDLQATQSNWLGLSFILPLADPTYNAAVSPFLDLSLPTKEETTPNSSSSVQKKLPPPPPPPAPPLPFSGQAIFYGTPASAIAIEINNSKQILLEGKEAKSLSVFQDSLSYKIDNTPPYKEGMQSGAIFYLAVAPQASYLSFLQAYYSLNLSHKTKLNNLSLAVHKQAYNQLDSDLKRALYQQLPLNLIYFSQLEYNFLNNLKKENKLDSFVQEHFIN